MNRSWQEAVVTAAIVLAPCGVGLVGCDDRCDKFIDRAGPLLTKYDQERAAPSSIAEPFDRDAQLASCKRALAADPNRAMLIDCARARPGDIWDALAECTLRVGL